jgi:hypothetical protein
MYLSVVEPFSIASLADEVDLPYFRIPKTDSWNIRHLRSRGHLRSDY